MSKQSWIGGSWGKGDSQAPESRAGLGGRLWAGYTAAGPHPQHTGSSAPLGGGTADQPGGLTAAAACCGRGLLGGASPQRLSHT